MTVRFKEDPGCRVFLSTDAGGVGLNLQSGSVVVNLDIPWNPAVLEQRVGRVHRLGQRKTVRVINFVSAHSIEERILELLRFKKSLSVGALDSDGENVVMVGESQLKRFMQSVETVTEAIEKAGPPPDLTEETGQKTGLKEGDQLDDRNKDVPLQPGGAPGLELLQPLLAAGARFLADLSTRLSPAPTPGPPGESRPAGPRLSRDPDTGKPVLNIPLPEPEVMQNILQVLKGFLSGF